MLIRHFLNIIFLLLYFTSAFGQEFGNSKIINHTKSQYHGGTQTYEITQDDHGYIFAANNNGLLMYNGTEWNCFPQPNQTILRSIEVVGERIYSGGQNELGYFYPSLHGKLKYTSLIPDLPASIENLEDIWSIDAIENHLIIRSSRHLIRFEGDSSRILVSNDALKSSFIFNESYFYQTNDTLRNLTSTSSFPLPEGTICKGMVMHFNDTLLVTENKGLMDLKGFDQTNRLTLSQILLEQGVNAVDKTSKGFAFATRRGGLILTNELLKPIRQYSVEQGLQRNDIISIFEDTHNDLWVGMSNGIDYIEESSPFKYSHPDSYLLGAGHAVAEYNGNLYCGTSNGLFKAMPQKIGKTKFELIDGTIGQVWGLEVINGFLWVGHQNGAFVLDKEDVQRIEGATGTWTFFEIPNDPEHVIAGHYDGLYLFEQIDNEWSLKRKINGFDESSRIGCYAGNLTWWISHPYKGAWKIKLSPTDYVISEIKHYGLDQGFPSNLHIYVSNVSGQIIFTAEEGLFVYNEMKDKILPINPWNSEFDLERRFLRLFGNEFETIWAVTERNVELLEINETPISKTWNLHTISRLKDDMVGGFEMMYFSDKNRVIVGTESGFAHIHLPTLLSSMDETPELRISSVDLIGKKDSTIYSDLIGLKGDSILRVPQSSTSFRFNFTSTSFYCSNELTYEVYLEGFETDWTPIETSFSKEYTNLEPGAYSFHFRALNEEGEILSAEVFQISIKIPWYQTRTALIIAIALGMMSLTLMILVPRRRFEREKNEIVLQKDRELTDQKEESVQALDELKNERLQDELNFKNKELASATMHLVQKGQILQSVRDSLKVLNLEAKEKSESQIRRIVKVINEDIRLDNNWEQFERHFDQVHVNFLKRLRQAYPNLTANDHKLCAYLRMTLSTKEIATIMNISVRGVEISRYRLRKKLELSSEENLSDFIQAL